MCFGPTKIPGKSWPLYRSCWLFTALHPLPPQSAQLRRLWYHGSWFLIYWVCRIYVDLSSGAAGCDCTFLAFLFINKRGLTGSKDLFLDFLRSQSSELKPRADLRHRNITRWVKSTEKQRSSTWKSHLHTRTHICLWIQCGTFTHTYTHTHTLVLVLDMWRVIPCPCESSNAIIALILLT